MTKWNLWFCILLYRCFRSMSSTFLLSIPMWYKLKMSMKRFYFRLCLMKPLKVTAYKNIVMKQENSSRYLEKVVLFWFTSLSSQRFELPWTLEVFRYPVLLKDHKYYPFPISPSNPHLKPSSIYYPITVLFPK